MKKLMLLWNVLHLMAVEVNSLEIKLDPRMREGQPSYIYCDVGNVTTGVTFYTVPANVKGTCYTSGGACSSTIVAYTVSQNSTGVLLMIASVDLSRDKGDWYCQHSTDKSGTISVNNHTIAGFLLRHDWIITAQPVETFSAVMTLSCANQVPDFDFTFEDSKSNTGTVPLEALTTTTQSSYEGQNCENGNMYYVIKMSASYKLDVFNNKTGVTFTFNYYEDDNTTAPFSVDFREYVAEPTTESPRTELTTESPRTGTGCDGLCDWEIVTIVVVVVLVILTVVIIIYCLKKKKKFCFKADENKATTGENTTTNNGVRNGTEYPIGLTSR